ncbi:hypothetical protein EJ02DRAFT_87348 [Clathrospora elynae]|uniref:Uncharacterized protein n=1 Tax=Clathrospora elynae TaxID=706981 RepID=A0A6A5S736_9PLEO|nr:hypothetical protein EJ02DRAFT_87348 [Clathrospora elynae]
MVLPATRISCGSEICSSIAFGLAVQFFASLPSTACSLSRPKRPPLPSQIGPKTLPDPVGVALSPQFIRASPAITMALALSNSS